MIRLVIEFVGAIDVLVLVAEFDSIVLSEFESDSAKESVLVNTSLRTVINRIEIQEQLIRCRQVKKFR